MLTIRFARVGKKNKAQYRIALQEKSYAPGGRHVEILGSYDPHLKQVVLKEDRIRYWLEKGVQLSDSVHNLFVKSNVISDKKRPVKMSKKKKEGEETGKVEGEEKKEEIKAPEVQEKNQEEVKKGESKEEKKEASKEEEKK